MIYGMATITSQLADLQLKGHTMKITIEIDDDSLFDMINEGASYSDKSVDRAKFDELVKWADFQQALTVKLEQVLYEDFEFMQDFEWLYSGVAKFDMFTSYDANDVTVEERSSGYWVTDGDGLVEGPFDDYETAVKAAQEKK
jgi:hypothetical protein